MLVPESWDNLSVRKLSALTKCPYTHICISICIYVYIYTYAYILHDFDEQDNNVKTKRQRRNQDGGVERCALTPSCENTRITTSCWTIIDRKTLELTKKDTPHPKTKEKPQ